VIDATVWPEASREMRVSDLLPPSETRYAALLWSRCERSGSTA